MIMTTVTPMTKTTKKATTYKQPNYWAANKPKRIQEKFKGLY